MHVQQLERCGGGRIPRTRRPVPSLKVFSHILERLQLKCKSARWPGGEDVWRETRRGAAVLLAECRQHTCQGFKLPLDARTFGAQAIREGI